MLRHMIDVRLVQSHEVDHVEVVDAFVVVLLGDKSCSVDLASGNLLIIIVSVRCSFLFR